MKEISRVCKPGRLVITINPVTWTFHEAPFDCWRIYPDGMKALSEYAELDVLLSTWESVETDTLLKWFPEYMRQKKIRLQKISQLLAFAGELLRTAFRGSFDTITIARKR